MSDTIRVAVDVMGGDHGPALTVPAALQVSRELAFLELILVGDAAQIKPYLQPAESDVLDRVVLKPASQIVAMNEKPSVALRSKQDSSIHIAMQLVRDGQADAVVSAGNSGALMAIGRHILKMLPGIDRPAMCAQVPDVSGHCYLLDLGANINCSSDHLYQYAIMGSVVASVVDKIDQPKVGLLNVGKEDIKGNEQIKLAARLLEENSRINYIGYVEADKIFEHVADVVVCDGFAGNVVLKASEGVAYLIKHKITDIVNHSWYSGLMKALVAPLIKVIGVEIDPGRLNGASLLGLQGSVVKSHGAASQESFASAIRLAVEEANKNVPQLINQQLQIIGY